ERGLPGLPRRLHPALRLSAPGDGRTHRHRRARRYRAGEEVMRTKLPFIAAACALALAGPAFAAHKKAAPKPAPAPEDTPATSAQIAELDKRITRLEDA